MTASPQFAVKFGAHQAVVQDGEIESSPPLFPLSLSSLLSLFGFPYISVLFLCSRVSAGLEVARCRVRENLAELGSDWQASLGSLDRRAAYFYVRDRVLRARETGDGWWTRESFAILALANTFLL